MKSSFLTFLLMLVSFGSVTAQSRHNAETAKQLDIFNSLYRELDLYYVDTLNATKNIGNAILYMLDQVDPYTEYYSESHTDDLKQMTTGKYAGIGAVISARKDIGRCIISHPYEGMPAAVAGLRAGDVILSVNGVDMGEIGQRELSEYSSAVSAALRGDAGTICELRVRRPGVSKELKFRLTRRTITLPSVTCATMLADSVGYVLLSSYIEQTGREVRLAVADLKRKGATKLILDLRDNPGGVMSAAVDVVNLFLPKGKEVLDMRSKSRENSATFKTRQTPLDLDMPIVVLTSFETASAAEITAGALQDYDRAVILGQNTYGKGLVQETRELPYGGYLKLTTSKYYIPSGRCVQAYKYENGRPVSLPDSLARTFHTAAGRPVKDGGGITPDVVTKADTMPDLLIQLALSDQLFDYAVDYCHNHPQIAEPETFSLTDAEYEGFRQYIQAHGFTYETRTKAGLDRLRLLAAYEGYDEMAKAELDALEKKIVSNQDYDFTHWQSQIRAFVEAIIVQQRYYDSGVARYKLREDKDVNEALQILRDEARYRRLLSPPSQVEE